MKLAKYIAHCGLMSRRKAEALIPTGVFTVNGETITNVALRVAPEDHITYQGKVLTLNATHTTIAYYKPAGIISTTQDEQGRETVIGQLPKRFSHLKPVGRLDKNSEGLLLLTDDGDLHQALTHPKYEKEKEYLVTVKGILSYQDAEKLTAGMVIPTEDGPLHTKPCIISHIEKRKETTQFHIVLKEGKKRQIRLMCAHLGYTVTTLKRIRIGTVYLVPLSPNQWRVLGSKEIQQLTGSYKKKTTTSLPKTT